MVDGDVDACSGGGTGVFTAAGYVPAVELADEVGAAASQTLSVIAKVRIEARP
jgi:hypothetical protein